MKALVLSDSHGDTEALSHIISSNIHAVGHVIHLGDGCGDMALFSYRYPEVSFHVVSGNCDCAPAFPEKRIAEIGGKKILIAHGHRYGVKTSYDRICYAAQEAGADICLFGHTHVPVTFEYEGILFMNPGAVCARGNGRPQYGIIDFTDEPPNTIISNIT